jgi:hypothetical protein
MNRWRETFILLWRCAVDRLDRYGTGAELETELNRIRAMWHRSERAGKDGT